MYLIHRRSDCIYKELLFFFPLQINVLKYTNLYSFNFQPKLVFFVFSIHIHILVTSNDLSMPCNRVSASLTATKIQNETKLNNQSGKRRQTNTTKYNHRLIFDVIFISFDDEIQLCDDDDASAFWHSTLSQFLKLAAYSQLPVPKEILPGLQN